MVNYKPGPNKILIKQRFSLSFASILSDHLDMLLSSSCKHRWHWTGRTDNSRQYIIFTVLINVSVGLPWMIQAMINNLETIFITP